MKMFDYTKTTFFFLLGQEILLGRSGALGFIVVKLFDAG